MGCGGIFRRFADSVADIALSSISLESEVVFSDTPRGGFAGEQHNLLWSQWVS